jgi:uncharacterized protein (DUF1501 family)
MLRHQVSRRSVLASSGILFAWPFLPRLARAEGRDPRFLVIVLRGALDGLAAVAPVGDPGWVKLRGDKALTLDGAAAGLPLDGFFALNPAMPNLHRLFRAGHATIVHAAATSYRDRSHFDGQDVLESGAPGPGAAETGWLNRALSVMQPDGMANRGGRRAFAVGPVDPLVVRGPAPILTWTPPRILPASDDTTERVLALYSHRDPDLARALQGGVGLAAMAHAEGIDSMRAAPQGDFGHQVRAFFTDSAASAAKFLARADGPRVGAISFNGWDTHIDEGAAGGRLATLLGALDDALAAAETGMGDAWHDTVIAVVTEFGRTARINGTNGTDHGTATVALLAGGALRGGRVVADWPGVKESDLYEGRDLKPTTDLRAVLKGVLRDHLRVPDEALAATIFPNSAAVRPLDGLTA